MEALLVRVFNECQQTQAVHRRCIKELVRCRREFTHFSDLFTRCVTPLFQTMKKEPAVERLIKLVTAFVTYEDDDRDECGAFLEKFFTFLLAGVDAANKCVRYRCCQLLSEIVLSLADDAEVRAESLGKITACMQRRMLDKVAGIRVYAVRALAWLSSGDRVGDANDSTIRLFRQCLSSDPSPDVRKAAVSAMLVSDLTIADIVERTGDVCGAVRKAAFSVIASKIPISSLSIRQRTIVLQRGLLDREPAVSLECRSMLKDWWLASDCEKDVLVLLKYLDVETNEKVGDLVMQELLKEYDIEVDQSRSLRCFLTRENTESDNVESKIQLMEAEEALYWKALCTYLYLEAEAKRSEAAKTRGAHASVLEAEAADKAQMLEAVLPLSVADFVALVDAHQSAGAMHAFASRQLLILATVLDFSDTASRKSAASMINKFLSRWTNASQYDTDIIGDGVHLGGEKKWSDAVVQLAQKVHASPGAFVEALTEALVETGKPCREGGAPVLEWLQCLAVTGILLEHLKSLRQFPVHIIQTDELVDGLLLPAVNHLDFDVQNAAVKCLSMYCQLEGQPSQRIIWQLEAALNSSSTVVAVMATKGLFDLIMCHGAAAVDEKRKIGADISESCAAGIHLASKPRQVPLLQVLLSLLHSTQNSEEEDGETVQSVAAEGFAKLLMHSRFYPELDFFHTSAFTSLLRLYFDEGTKVIARLRQCLSVFFHNYPSVAAEHKRCISKSFIPLMRELWPGLNGSSCHSNVATARKKCATQLSRFMLELLRRPLYSQQRLKEAEDGSVVDDATADLPDEGFEYLAIKIASEIGMPAAKKSAAVKAYKSTLCKVLVSLKFRPSEQETIKCMRKLLDRVVDAMSGEKLLLKELKAMALELKKLDQSSDQVLDVEQLGALLASMGIDASEKAPAEVPKTPAPRTKQKPVRRAAADSDNDFETPPPRAAAGAEATARTQRTCKTVAMKRMEHINTVKTVDFDPEAGSSSSSSSGEITE